MSRWWKCDLQVASPGAKDFRGPTENPWSLEDEASRQAAATRYMERARAAGLEVLVLADHNDATWIEPMTAAGDAVGIVVFPGVEVTTGSGADGIHLIIIGDRGTTTHDFDDVLSRVCGFGGDHPRFDPRLSTPASAPRTLLQILDDLPDDYLAIAPHAFNDNGIASANTVKGDLRWKALHHERLGAIDVGDIRALEDPASWHGRFARRELTDFPCLPALAFVSTSDAYSLDRLGQRYTWIRMAEPTLEALRQAFLDHEARVVCDWDEAHPAGASPNSIGHAWVGRLSLRGLTTAPDGLDVELDPRLTVIIGGRGSGKSSVVAGLRLLYGDVESLPGQARTEFQDLRDAVFGEATVEAEHYLPHSGERQMASWTLRDGPRTVREVADGAMAPTETDFKVRVINQKELFERAAHSADDPSATSRNLLHLVDDALATGSAGPGGPAAFDEALSEAQTAWISAARAHQAEIDATAQRDIVAARVEELRRQVAAFDDPANKTRRERNDLLMAQRAWLEATSQELIVAADALSEELERRVPATVLEPPTGEDTDAEVSVDLAAVREHLSAIWQTLREDLTAALRTARTEVARLGGQIEGRPWHQAVEEAVADSAKYRQELAALGVDPEEYARVRRRLEEESTALERLDQRLARLPELAAVAESAWQTVEALLEGRRARRQVLLAEVAERSELLKFTLTPHADVTQWSRRVRGLLNLRSDGFLEDVPALGRWVWEPQPDDEEQRRRHALWRRACVTGDLSQLSAEAGLRSAWQQRIADLDPVLRARLGSEVADDVVVMEFLRERGDPNVDDDWKPLTAGSPGQRSAAMLSFVMHHGVDPLVLDQPEDDLDTEWITQLVVRQLRTSRWTRQVVVVTHNANIPVNADAERVIVLENHGGGIRVRRTATGDGMEVEHVGALEQPRVRRDIQQIMEGGVAAFVRRERRYNNELNAYRAAMRALTAGD